MGLEADEFFPVFAAHATKFSLEKAILRFRGNMADGKLESYIEEYERRIAGIDQSDPPILSGPRDPWYPGPNDDDEYWPKLRSLFEDSLGWSETTIGPVDKSSSKIVAYTPRLTRDKWTAKGLVVGYVQSGKTTNFTSVIAKAADVGYRLVIVLSGIHNGLRRQTQLRLRNQLHDLTPTDWLTLTNEDSDFYKPSIPSTALLHGQKKVALCVVKKNQAVLARLNAWLEDASKAGVLNDLPTLIIDDEADQASVQTKRINPLIRKIIDKLPKCTYIGYTATPFANVLIDPAADDLYPAEFIVNLPRPEGYFGTEQIFGREAVEGDDIQGAELDGHDMVRPIDEAEVELLTPVGKKAATGFSPTITDSLDRAVKWFWLATAARRARGDEGHSTMLVHTSMKIDVHESYKDPLLDLRDAAARALSDREPGFLAELKNLWDEESARVPSTEFGGLAPLTFEEVRPKLDEVVVATKIVLDNCRSEDRLDYESGSQIAIAVGGNTLSRGLTLEGLVVSFFARSAQAYDTLLQMARWFGFRRGYEDLPRIWMTSRLQDWFRHLATVEHEIRMDIDRYEQQALTPREFGVRIRTHPVLRVTGKMGAYRPNYYSYGGRRIQTRYFRENDSEWLRANLHAADTLIRGARAGGGIAESLDNGESLYRGVDVDHVLKFLHTYRTHEDSPDLDGTLIQKYIAKQRASGGLESWNIAVMAGANDSNGSLSLGGINFNRISRSKLNGTGPDRADIKTLMSKDHRVVDLRSVSRAEARKQDEASLVDARNNDPSERDRGLLLLYPINPRSIPDSSNEKTRSPLVAVEDVIGLAMVFPGNADRGSDVKYISVDLRGVEEPDEAELAMLEGAE